MTTPVVHGYPDWARQVARADVVYLDVSETISNVKTHATKFVGATPCVGIDFTAASGIWCTIELNWLSAQSGGTTLHSEEFVVGGNGKMALSIPAIGPYLQISISPESFNYTYSMTVWATYEPRVLFGAAIRAPLLIDVTNGSIGAGATVTIDAEYTVPGMACFQLYCDAATFDGGVRAMINSTTPIDIVTFIQTLPIAPHLIYLPAAPVRFLLHNSAAVARNYFVHIYSHSIGLA